MYGLNKPHEMELIKIVDLVAKKQTCKKCKKEFEIFVMYKYEMICIDCFINELKKEWGVISNTDSRANQFESKMQEIFNNAEACTDTLWYNDTTTLFDMIMLEHSKIFKS